MPSTDRDLEGANARLPDQPLASRMGVIDQHCQRGESQGQAPRAAAVPVLPTSVLAGR